MSPLRGPPTHIRDAHREDTRSAHPALHRRRRFFVPADGNWDSPDLESKRNELVETTLSKPIPIHYKHVQRDEIFQRYKMMLKSLFVNNCHHLASPMSPLRWLLVPPKWTVWDQSWVEQKLECPEGNRRKWCNGWMEDHESVFLRFILNSYKKPSISLNFTQRVQNKFFSAGEGWWFHHSLFWYLHAITPSPPLGSNVWTER